ncbi:MAG: hypothetical protein K2P14_05195 [Anaeroplasmataceae bacterium]|nr:hypothetical protein [Anaeroplasmataceae bacterium]
MYKYYNANANNNFVNDCVIRAISVAEDMSWSDTYDDLSRIAKKNGILLDDVNFVEPLLDYRYKKIKTYSRGYSSRYFKRSSNRCIFSNDEWTYYCYKKWYCI